MRISWLLSLPSAILSVTSALAIESRDADFYSVRTRLHKDMSGRRGDPKGKYFHESVFHPHYDGRFADTQLDYVARKKALSNLVQTYLATLADIGVETWLMHGTLLGWWWNRKVLPWDSDVDVQVSESSMHFMASYYNMSIFHYRTPRIPEGRDYMLEVNPYYVNREQTDRLNVIDARWVDTTSGLFIDITTARYNYTHPAGEGMLSCKDGHEYRDTYIFPLRDTYFEGMPAKIPYAYTEILEAEYRRKALTQTTFENHYFDDEKLEWIPLVQKIAPPVRPEGNAAQAPPKAPSPVDGPPKNAVPVVAPPQNAREAQPPSRAPAFANSPGQNQGVTVEAGLTKTTLAGTGQAGAANSSVTHTGAAISPPVAPTLPATVPAPNQAGARRTGAITRSVPVAGKAAEDKRAEEEIKRKVAEEEQKKKEDKRKAEERRPRSRLFR